MEEYVKKLEEESEQHKQKVKETVMTRDSLGLLGDGAELRDDFPSPVVPNKIIIVPVDGSPDSWAALELGMQQALNPSPPGPYRLYVPALAYYWDKMPGSKEDKEEKASRYAESLKAEAIKRIMDFEKQSGKKLFYNAATVSVVGNLEKEFTKSYDRWVESHPDPSSHPRIIIGLQDPYAEAKNKKESDLLKQVWKHASTGTEIIVVDAQSNSIVKTSANLSSAFPSPSTLPSREQAIPAALAAIAAAHEGQASKAAAARGAGAAPPSDGSVAAAAAAPAKADPFLDATNKAFDDFEKELDASLGASAADAGSAAEAAVSSTAEKAEAATESVQAAAAAEAPTALSDAAAATASVTAQDLKAPARSSSLTATAAAAAPAVVAATAAASVSDSGVASGASAQATQVTVTPVDIDFASSEMAKRMPIAYAKYVDKATGKSTYHSTIAPEVQASHVGSSFTVTLRAENLAKKDLLGKSDGFIQVSRPTRAGGLVLVQASSIVPKSLSPTWPAMKMSLDALNRGDLDVPLLWEVLDDDNGSSELIGSFEASVSDMQKTKSFPLVDPKSSKKDLGVVIVESWALGNA
ncbi:hypothetical protein DFJ74DRAFT_772659 [Hyaloraphidium curvatum]|nr:hypothetical protein DFJ74DRAFT_772659 [Hyaloraphidium curvatum]